MDFLGFIFKIYIHICYYSKYGNEMLLKKMKFIKIPGLLSLCHTPSLFLSKIMKNQVSNKIVYSVMKIFNATKMFSIYIKDKDGKNFLNINMCRKKVFM
jgi:hypothetical protein